MYNKAMKFTAHLEEATMTTRTDDYTPPTTKVSKFDLLTQIANAMNEPITKVHRELGEFDYRTLRGLAGRAKRGEFGRRVGV